MRKVPKILQETITEISKSWLEAIKTQENILCVFPKGTAGYHRVYSLIEDQNLCKTVLDSYEKYRFHIIRTNQSNTSPVNSIANLFNIKTEVNTPDELVTQINLIYSKKNQHVFFIYFIDEWFTNLSSILFWLSFISDNCQNIQFVFLTEENIHKQNVILLLGKYHQLFQQIKYIPLYSRETLLAYIHNFGDFLKYPVSTTVATEILNLTGRHIALVKQATRLYCLEKKQPSEITQDINYKLKLSQIWNSFSKNEKNILETIIEEKIPDYKKFQEEIDHLQNLEIISKDKNENFVLNILGLNSFSNNHFTQKLSLYGTHIYLGSKIIDSEFTQQEHRILSLFLSQNKKSFSKNEIGDVISKNSNSYSDWSVDKAIFRLRKKIAYLKIDAQIITNKGRGYTWQN